MTSVPVTGTNGGTAASPATPDYAAALAATEQAAQRTARTRRRLLGVAPIVAAGALVAAVAVAPWEGDAGNAGWLRVIAESPARAQAGMILFWLAYLLGAPTVLALIQMTRRRATRLGTVGAVLGVLGTASQPGMLVVDAYDLTLATELPLEQALAVSDAVGEVAPAIIPMAMTAFLFSALGMLLLVVAAWRARWLPVWVPVVWVVGGLFFGFIGGPALTPMLAGSGLLAVAYVAIGLRVLRARDDEWASGLPAQG